MIYRRNYVTFFSPGTLFSESTSKPIEQWSPVVACAMQSTITERYGAKPYAFRFETRVESDPIDDGDGGFLNVEPHVECKSPMYHVNATINTAEQVEHRADPSESIMLSNMLMNGFAVAITTNSFKHCAAFERDDMAVDLLGNVVAFGAATETSKP